MFKTIRFKIFLLGFVLLTITAINNYVAYTNLEDINADTNVLVNENMPAAISVLLVSNNYQTILRQLILIYEHDPNGRKYKDNTHGAELHLNIIREQQSQLLANLRGVRSDTEIDESDKKLLQLFESKMVLFTIEVNKRILPELEKGIYNTNTFARIVRLNGESGAENEALIDVIKTNKLKSASSFQTNLIDRSHSVIAIAIAGLLFSIIGGFLYTWHISNNIRNHIDKMKNVVSTIASGDLSARSDTDLPGDGDELSDLSEALDDSIENMNDTMMGIKIANDDAAHQLSFLMQTTARLVEQINDQISLIGDITKEGSSFSDKFLILSNTHEQAKETNLISLGATEGAYTRSKEAFECASNVRKQVRTSLTNVSSIIQKLQVVTGQLMPALSILKGLGNAATTREQVVAAITPEFIETIIESIRGTAFLIDEMTMDATAIKHAMVASAKMLDRGEKNTESLHELVNTAHDATKKSEDILLSSTIALDEQVATLSKITTLIKCLYAEFTNNKAVCKSASDYSFGTMLAIEKMNEAVSKLKLTSKRG